MTLRDGLMWFTFSAAGWLAGYAIERRIDAWRRGFEHEVDHDGAPEGYTRRTWINRDSGEMVTLVAPEHIAVEHAEWWVEVDG